MVPKWSEAFREAVRRETGSRSFTYVTAVTRLSGDPSEWEQFPRFRKAMRGESNSAHIIIRNGRPRIASSDEDTCEF